MSEERLIKLETQVKILLRNDDVLMRRIIKLEHRVEELVKNE